MLKNSASIGRAGEEFAYNYFKTRGFSILDKNFRCSFAEIDLIIYKARKIYLVEVKTSKNDRTFPVHERFDERKYFKIINCGRVWLYKNEKYQNCQRTVLLIEVSYDGKVFSVANITEVGV